MRTDCFLRLFPRTSKKCAYLFYFGLYIIALLFVFLTRELTSITLVIIMSVICAGFLIVPLAFLACRMILQNLAGETHFFVLRHGEGPQHPETWLYNKMSFFEGSTGMFTSGAFFAALAAFAWYWHSPIRESYPWMQISILSLIGLSAFMAGLGLYAVGRSAAVFFVFGNEFDFIVHPHRHGVLSIGRALLKCYFTIISVVAVYTASGMVIYDDNVGGLLVDLRSPPMLFLAYPAGIFVIGAFVVSQVTIHAKMVQYKRCSLHRIEAILAELAPQCASELDAERERKIRFFQEERNTILFLPEWPSTVRVIGGAAFVSIYGLLMPPLVSAAVESGWEQLFSL